MQHPFGALTRNFNLIRLRMFRGQQSARPAGDGETWVVSAKCLMSLNGHLLRPRGTGPSLLLFQRIHCGAVYMLTVWKLLGHHIVLNTADTRHTVMPRRIPPPPPPPPRTIPHWKSVSYCGQYPVHRGVKGTPYLKKKFGQKCFFIKISKLALSGVMLKFERSQYYRKKEIDNKLDVPCTGNAG